MPDAYRDRIFVNRRTADVARARAFYGALGFAIDERFSGPAGIMVTVSDAIHLILLLPEEFERFAPGPVPPMGASDTLVSLSRPSRAAVDDFVAAAVAAGGAVVGQTDEHGAMMYGRSVADPDGNGLGVVWMDAAGMAGDGAAA